MANPHVLTNVQYDLPGKRFICTLTVAATETASSIFMGFKPKVVKMTQIAGSPDATSRSVGYDQMTAAYAVLVAAAGDLTIITSNGYTFLDGTEASPAQACTGSPGSSGPGVTIGTGVTANSLVYLFEAYG